MYRLVVLACAVASAAAVADPQVAYANGLAYGHGYAGFAAPYPYAAHGIAAAPLAAAPVAYAHAAPVAVAHAGLGLPEASAYVLPPVRSVAEAPIVEHIVEPVEQWGYKVAY